MAVCSNLGTGVPDELQQRRLQQHVEPLRNDQVLGPAQVAQAEQQSLDQHQEGDPSPVSRCLLLLHQLDQLLQLRSKHSVSLC